MPDEKTATVMINGAELDSLLRAAVQRVMTSAVPSSQDVATVQEIVDRKAHDIRAPISEMVRRIKMAG
jgi:hypothetical protein